MSQTRFKIGLNLQNVKGKKQQESIQLQKVKATIINK